MTGMDDLVTWLRAALDEDEAEAREALSRQTTQRRMIQGRMMDVPIQPMPEWRRSVCPPARVLAEVDAKRRILDRYEDAIARQIDHDYSLIAADVQAEEYRDWVLPLLALPYAGRPGYREEWRP